MDVEGGEALVAGEAFGHRVVLVRSQVDDLVVFNLGDEAAGRLTHATKRGDFFSCVSHGVRVPFTAWRVLLVAYCRRVAPAGKTH